MDIEDRKRPRDLTLESDYSASKKLKLLDIPLQESDFPEGVLDLEPLSSDEVEEFAAELAAELAPSSEVEVIQEVTTQPIHVSTDVVKEARPKRPPRLNESHGLELSRDWWLSHQRNPSQCHQPTSAVFLVFV
ncbi:hypothetical protein LINGRAHAP2_LOCUS23971 [Linum grandiflorum]